MDNVYKFLLLATSQGRHSQPFPVSASFFCRKKKKNWDQDVAVRSLSVVALLQIQLPEPDGSGWNTKLAYQRTDGIGAIEGEGPHNQSHTAWGAILPEGMVAQLLQDCQQVISFIKSDLF